MNKQELITFFDRQAEEEKKWKNRNWYYYQDIANFCSYLIPENKTIIDIGCGDGSLLAKLKPKYGYGIDMSLEYIKHAQKNYPKLNFLEKDADSFSSPKKFDYIILSHTVSYLQDIQKALTNLHKNCLPHTRLIIIYHNYLWEPLLKLGEKIGLKRKEPGFLNWLNYSDLKNMLELSGFEIIKRNRRLLFPKYLPLISNFLNRYIAKLPIINIFCLTEYIIARPKLEEKNWQKKYSVSVVVPARNEKGNIENIVQKIPKLGKKTEIIFVEGHSTDGTWEEIKRIEKKYRKTHKIIIVRQNGKGKGDAVRKGFDLAKGDILMILDADLTVPPSDLSKFYHAIAQNKGEFINGTRLVYPMEKQAMRFLNIIGNRFFSFAFTYLLDQPFKDTLCGTKVISRKNYQKIKEGRSFFGDFDPFGDFDLIFGASKLNLKIVEIPIRYKERTYGQTNISRFKHGWLLLRMCFFASKKIKFV